METRKSKKLQLLPKDPIARAKYLTHGVLAPADPGADFLPRMLSSCSSAAESSNPPSPPTPYLGSRSIGTPKSFDRSSEFLKLGGTPRGSVDGEAVPSERETRAKQHAVCGRDLKDGTDGIVAKRGVKRAAGIAVGGILVLGSLMAVICVMMSLKVVQDLAGEIGLLDRLVRMAQGSNRLCVLASLHLIKGLTRGNNENKNRVVHQGVLPVLISTINSKLAADGDQISALQTIGGLAKGSTLIRDALLANGAIPAMMFATRADNLKVKFESMNTLAILLASRDDIFRNSVMAVQGVDAMVEMLDSGMKPSHSASVVWALANLAHGNAVAQNSIALAGGIKPLIRLLWSGSDQLESQVALLAVGNLVVHNSLNQDAVRDAGGVEATVKLLEASVEALSSKTAFIPLEVEFIQEILEAYKRNHAIRSAIREIGGIRSFIQLALPEDFELLQALYPFHNSLVTIRGDSSRHGLHGLSENLDGWAESNLELDGENSAGKSGAGIEERNDRDDAKCRQKAQAVLMEEMGLLGDRALVERACWVLGNLAANNSANEDAVRKVGGIEVLLQIVGSTAFGPVAVKSAACTLATLASKNAVNRIVIRKAHGVESLIRLIGTHPDKDVVHAAAKLLKVLGSGKTSRPEGKIGMVGKWVFEKIRFANGGMVVDDDGKIVIALAWGGMFLLGVLCNMVFGKGLNEKLTKQ